MNRAAFCRRMLPALRLCAKQGYIRNDRRTRELLGYDLGISGSKHLSNRLCGYSTDGLLVTSTTAVGHRRLYRLSTRGRLALETNAKHAQRNTPSSKLAAYFAARGGDLSPADICVRFGISKEQARRAVDYLVSIGVAERVRVVRAVRVSERLAA